MESGEYETAFVRGRVTVLSRFRSHREKKWFVTCTASGVQRGTGSRLRVGEGVNPAEFLKSLWKVGVFRLDVSGEVMKGV